jgi:ABC-type polysaccharide/polyol phosphate export permease
MTRARMYPGSRFHHDLQKRTTLGGRKGGAMGGLLWLIIVIIIVVIVLGAVFGRGRFR